MGGKDHTVPETVSKSTHKKYRHSQATTQLAEFAVRGHSLTIDHGWREIADSVLSWLKVRGSETVSGWSGVTRHPCPTWPRNYDPTAATRATSCALYAAR